MPQLRLPFSCGAAAFALAFAALLPLSAAQAQESDTLAKIKASGAITFGYRESSFGFSYPSATASTSATASSRR